MSAALTDRTTPPPGLPPLGALLREAAEHCPLYRGRYAAAGIRLAEFDDPSALSRLPILAAEDLIGAGSEVRNNAVRPYRVTCSSGSSGRPKMLFRTLQDTTRSVEIMVRLFGLAGLEAGDALWLGQPFDLAHVGFLALQAAEVMGILCYPGGLSITDAVLVEFLDTLRPNAIFTAPSRMLQLTRIYASRLNRPPLSTILLAGEPCSTSQKRQIVSFWGARVANLYGSEETDGLAASCGAGDALHFMDDAFLLELMVPGTDRPASSGWGEAVITCRYMRGTPLIRYRTGDVLQLDGEPCPCGAPWPTIRVLGRSNATFHLYDGVSLHDFQLRSAMARLGINRFQAVLRTDSSGLDDIELIIDAGAIGKRPTVDTIIAAATAASLDLQASIDMCKLTVRARFGDDFHRTPRGKTPELVNLRVVPS